MLFKDPLIPAVVQHYKTKQVLMLGYMNQAALQKTLATSLVTFYSRSKKRLWTKGESSHHFLVLIDLKIDCDQDTLLILANPQGPTCHTGHKTCFYKSMEDFLLQKIFKIYEYLRDEDLNEQSNTSRILKEKPAADFLQRHQEELAELQGVINGTHQHTTYEEDLILESHQALYHLILYFVKQNKTCTDLKESEEYQNLLKIIAEEGITISRVVLHDYEQMEGKEYLRKVLGAVT